jgi:hypothetical protein
VGSFLASMGVHHGDWTKQLGKGLLYLSDIGWKLMIITANYKLRSLFRTTTVKVVRYKRRFMANDL